MSFDEEMKNALKTFTLESLELLQDMEEHLLNLEDDEAPAERINAIFRAAHTIKGSSGVFGLTHIVAFTHVVESVLDELRGGRIGVGSELVAALLPCCDHITLLVRNVVDGRTEEDAALTAEGKQLLDELNAFTQAAPADKAVTEFKCPREQLQKLENESVKDGNWHLSLRFGADSFRDGMDPLSFVSYLRTLGDIVQLVTICQALPPADEMDPETCYLGFEIELKSSAGKAEIEGVFEFVRESSIIRILPYGSGIDEFIELIDELPENLSYLGEILVAAGAITRHELDDALHHQQDKMQTAREQGNAEAEAAVPALGEILVKYQAVSEPVLNAALEKQKQVKEKKNQEAQSIRVDAERLDKLIDLIGELVIAGAGVNLRSRLFADEGLKEMTGETMRLIEEVRDGALQLRMVPIGTTFSRFQRVVRDVSKELGKGIDLIVTGGDTEVDKSVVEKIGDPLMHLVRNAMDHGIETADVRLACGKPARGSLTLKAYHSSGSIVIEVGDDGGGLNRERILAKAVERGLIQAHDVLSDHEVYALIFEPGFSTAQTVSNLSGRGVGMDVVKRNVTALRGNIEVDSRLGAGTTMRIHLPLTLAIIDGFLVGVGKATFVIPLDRVIECVALPEDAGEREYMDLRGEVLPLVWLSQVFDVESHQQRRHNVVVVEHAGNKAGFVVDRLQGEFQTVIKPLGKLFTYIKGVAGSTILGDGKVALIVDVPTLFEFCERANRHAEHALPAPSHAS